MISTIRNTAYSAIGHTKRWLRIIILTTVPVFPVVCCAIMVALQISQKPLLINLENTSQATFAKDGALLRISLTGDEKYRLFTPLSLISPDVISATIKYEDRWFWYHPGVNILSIIRASFDNLT